MGDPQIHEGGPRDDDVVRTKSRRYKFVCWGPSYRFVGGVWFLGLLQEECGIFPAILGGGWRCCGVWSRRSGGGLSLSYYEVALFVCFGGWVRWWVLKISFSFPLFFSPKWVLGTMAPFFFINGSVELHIYSLPTFAEDWNLSRERFLSLDSTKRLWRILNDSEKNCVVSSSSAVCSHAIRRF